MRNKLLIVLGVIVVVMVAIFALRYANSPKQITKLIAKPVLVQASRVKVVKMPLVLSAVGTLAAKQSIAVSAESSGYITGVFFMSGQRVKKGDLLLQLDATKTKSQFEASKAAALFAKTKYDRALKLLHSNSMARQAVDSLYADMQEKSAVMRQDQNDLEHKKIYAPFAGFLGEKTVALGQYITAGQKIVDLIDKSSLKVDYSVPEQYLTKLRLGQNITLTCNAFDDKVFAGKVTYIAPAVDPDSHMITLGSLVPNSFDSLYPGLFVRIRQIIAADNAAMMIPEHSLVRSLNGLFVYKIIDDKVQKTTVKTGRRQDGYVEITSGLHAGDEVVTAGLDRLQGGTKIQILH